MMVMKKIIGIGNALVDVLAMLDSDEPLTRMQLARGGMELIDDERFSVIHSEFGGLNTTMATGGAAANTVLALAHLGAEPGFVGRVACDDYGRFFMRVFSECGVRLQLQQCVGGHTGVASAFVSPDGERTFATCLGVAAHMRAEDITDTMFAGYDYLYIEGYLVQSHRLMETVLQTARRMGVCVVMDMASYNIVEAERDFFLQLLRDYVDVVLANEEESRVISGGLPPREALDFLSRLCGTAVVKLGAAGAVASAGGETVHCASEPVNCVKDTTGAGDFFAGGFLYALSRGASLVQSLSAGALLGARVIETVGTTLSSETWSEIRLKVERILQN